MVKSLMLLLKNVHSGSGILWNHVTISGHR
jgi:hypothetical protein